MYAVGPFRKVYMHWNEFSASLSSRMATGDNAIKKAFKLGEKMHKGQMRLSGEAYFGHPAAVALLLADMGADKETIIAGLLHDTVEDTELTLPLIRAEFGEPIAHLIEGATKISASDLKK